MKKNIKKTFVLAAVITPIIFIFITAFTIFNSSLQEKYRMLGNGTIFQSVNYIDNYLFLGELKLPSDKIYNFKYTAPKSEYISFYQIRLSDFNFPKIKEIDNYCRKKFPQLLLNLESSIYQTDKYGEIIRDNNGRAKLQTTRYTQQERNKKSCLNQYKYGHILLRIRNNHKKILMNISISEFGGQSVKVTKGDEVYITIKTSTPKNNLVAPMHSYNLYIK